MTAHSCAHCKFWSDKLATANTDEGLRAMCLNNESPEYQEYTAEDDNCWFQEIGTPIDE